MARKFSASVRTARAQAIETTVGTAPILELRSGAPPTNPSDADSGTLLASMTLPSDWLSISSGVASKLGTWQDLSADATGILGHYRVKDSGGTTCHDQGTVTATGGGGDMTVDNTSVAAGQQVTITAWGWTEPNA
jgi:hypothetical protein